jgi:hypothetical protein
MITATLIAAFSLISADVVVHYYNEANVSSFALAEAIRVANVAFRRAHLDVRWINCHREAQGTCSSNSTDRAYLDILIQPSNPPSPGNASRTFSMGQSIVVPGSTSTYAKIFMSKVRQYAEATDVPIASVLGLAIAHEAGHLLLATSAHSGNGVMKAMWTRADRHLVAGGHFAFQSQEARSMRLRLTGSGQRRK